MHELIFIIFGRRLVTDKVSNQNMFYCIYALLDKTHKRKIA